MKKVTIILLIGVVCLLSNTAFSAGDNIGGKNLSGTVDLSDLWVNYHSYNSDDTSVASVNFTLKDALFGGASWNFYANSDDPSRWTANMHLNGWYLEDGLAPDSFEKDQNSNIDFSDVHLSNDLDIDYLQEDAFLKVWGYSNISPAIITSADFWYGEHEDPWLDLTRWDISYYVRGYFVADTLEEAQAMGAPFVAIPEPATMIFLGLGAISLIRRRRK